jgi:hypothetical protein
MKPTVPLSPDDRNTLVNSLTNAVSVLQQLSTTEKRTNVRENILPKYEDDFLVTLYDVLKDPLIRTQIARMIANSYARSDIEECIMLLPHLGVEPNLMVYGTLMVLGLREYRQLPQGDARGSMTAQQKKQCIALMLVVKTLEYEYDGVPPVGQSATQGSFLTEEALVETVMEHADKIDVIVDIITERNLCTAEDIAPLLQPLHSSLAAGAL